MDGSFTSGDDGTVATIGILHPGAMGASLGAAATSNGHTALWVAQGRSDVTRRRAEVR